MSSRYFRNPYLDDDDKLLINKPIYKRWILGTIKQIMRCFEPSVSNGEKDDLNASFEAKDSGIIYGSIIEDQCCQRLATDTAGLYTGTAGVAYALLRVVSSNLFPEKKREFLNAASSYIEAALDDDNMRSRKKIGLLSGNSGVLLVAALLAKKRSDDKECLTYLNEYKNLAEQCEPIDFLKNGSDEMFVGRAGYLYGITTLQKEFHIEILSNDSIQGLCNIVVESGKMTRQRYEIHGDLPLLYEYHSKAYLGAAHGMCGILQVLLNFRFYLLDEPEARNLIRRSIDYLLKLCYENANIATNLSAALGGQGKYLVHWCHGAAGIIYLFARAYLVFERDEKYLNACRKLADTVWREGLLKKGPGICHGVAGSGYAFLLMYRLTREEKYLCRAERFASFLFTEEFTDGARTPDRPFSLYEGWAGTICFLTDLLQPDTAEFPFMNVFLA